MNKHTKEIGNAHIERTPCHYCGVAADSVDHVVPRHILARAGGYGLNLVGVMRIRQWEVPCCRECNTLIGGALFSTMEGRVNYLKSRLRKRYRKLLALPGWTDAELQELGPELRQYVRFSLQARDVTKQRVAWKPPKYGDDLGAVLRLFKSVMSEK